MAHPTVVINNVVYADTPEVNIPKQGGGVAKFYDASETNVSASDVRNGKKFVGLTGEDTGSLADNGATGGTISTKAGTVTIPAGITTGGTVSIDPTAVSDLTASTLLSGKTVLGVSGTLSMPTISQDSTTKILSIS